MTTPGEVTPELERVARAMCRSYWDDGSRRLPGTLDAHVDEYWSNWLPEARAALLAIREPSEGMLRAAQDELADPTFGPGEARAAFTAAIDHILGSTPEGKG